MRQVSGSVFYQSPLTSHQILIGTRERLETRATRRKQTIATLSNRYRSRRVSRFLSRRFTRAKSSSSGLQPLASNLRRLPDTVSRVEMHLSHRKQTTATASTRHSVCDTFLRVPFAVPASNLQPLASRTLARIRAAGVTSVPQRPQDRAACIALLYALGADPNAHEPAVACPAGWRLL
jgi:hypothetical protein